MRKALIIDDDPVIRLMTETWLSEAGFRVLTASDGESGLQLARTEHPDVVVLDLMMPRMHGYTVCQEIQRDPELANTVLVVVSAKSYPVDIKKAKELGASAYLVKPYEREELLEAVGATVLPAPSSLRVKFWGTRGSIPTPGPKTLRYGGNTSCVEVRVGSHILMLDCGSGAREMGLELAREFQSRKIEAHIFVSHTHWDHIQGFPFFLPSYLPTARLNLYSVRGTDKSLEKLFTGQMDASYFPVQMTDMTAELNFRELDGVLEIGAARISHIYLNHPGLAVGYRVDVGQKAVVYVTDHEPYCRLSGDNEHNRKLDEALTEFARNADLYIRECQYTDEEYPVKRAWGHSTWRDALESAHAARVKRLALFHHDPMHDDETMDRIVAQCHAAMRQREMTFECFAAADNQEILV